MGLYYVVIFLENCVLNFFSYLCLNKKAQEGGRGTENEGGGGEEREKREEGSKVIERGVEKKARPWVQQQIWRGRTGILNRFMKATKLTGHT